MLSFSPFLLMRPEAKAGFLENSISSGQVNDLSSLSKVQHLHWYLQLHKHYLHAKCSLINEAKINVIMEIQFESKNKIVDELIVFFPLKSTMYSIYLAMKLTFHNRISHWLNCHLPKYRYPDNLLFSKSWKSIRRHLWSRLSLYQ